MVCGLVLGVGFVLFSNLYVSGANALNRLALVSHSTKICFAVMVISDFLN